MSEWISLKDRLPANGESVLFFINEDETSYIVQGWLDDTNYDDERRIILFMVAPKFNLQDEDITITYDGHCYNLDDDSVSYWMPLPKAPNE